MYKFWYLRKPVGKEKFVVVVVVVLQRTSYRQQRGVKEVGKRSKNAQVCKNSRDNS